MGACGVKRCRRVARQAFDMYDPWHARYRGVGQPAPGTPMRHYEVCDKHADEFWPRGPGYVEKEQAGRIMKRIEGLLSDAPADPSDVRSRGRNGV